MIKTLVRTLAAGLCSLFISAAVQAQTCSHRGSLDTPYCDLNDDLVADAPAVGINPDRLVIGISSVEDARTAELTYGSFVSYLGTCLKKDVSLYPYFGEATVLEALRTGRVHVAQFATGGTLYAVNFAGAVPFAGKGLESAKKRDTYTLMLIVRADSPYHKPSDLKGKKIAHTTLTSNSGNLAPRALFPGLGLVPDKDYAVEFSGKHDKSIVGVQLGLYDGAAIASDFFDRMLAKGEIKRNQFRILYESEEFPPDAFSHAYNLNSKLVANIKKCVFDFKFPDQMTKALEGNNRFFAVEYLRDWALIRKIADASGTKIDRAGYDKIIAPKK